MVTLFAIPIVLSFTHLISLKTNLFSPISEYIRSFSAGFSVAYVFLLLLPELPKIGNDISINTPLVSLIGFILFHEAHKYIFRKNDHNKYLLDEVHIFTASLYYFLITFFLIEIMKVDSVQGSIITGIIVLHAVLSEITESTNHYKNFQLIKTGIMIFATLVGGILAITETVSLYTTAFLFAFTSGAIVYISIREEIPNEERGKPYLFVIGAFSLMLVQTLLLS